MTAAAGTELSTAKRLLLEKMLRGERMAAVPGGGSGADAVPPRAPGVAPPLAAEQRQVWLHAAMVPDLPLYNEPVTIRRRGPFDLAVLEESFNEVLRRHEIWRTSFAAVGTPMPRRWCRGALGPARPPAARRPHRPA